MSIDINTILDKVVSHALAAGVFDRVNGHEPKVAPGVGVTCAVWVDSINPVLSSGLNSTSIRLALNIRIYTSMMMEPQDAIDPNLVTAVDTLMTAYNGDFELGGSVRKIDLLGSDGPGLSAQAGYVNQNDKIMRVFSIMMPVIVNDAWDQVA